MPGHASAQCEGNADANRLLAELVALNRQQAEHLSEIVNGGFTGDGSGPGFGPIRG